MPSVRGARLLLVLPQLPQDPASGAARSTRTICEMLAAAGMEVRVVATTSSEAASTFDAKACLAELGIRVQTFAARAAGRTRPELGFVSRGVSYRLLDTGHRGVVSWQQILSKQFDLLFDRELHEFRPDIVFAFGGLPGEHRRYQRARRQGAKLVFALRNDGYLNGGDFLREMDSILTPSRFLSDLYMETTGVASVPLPVPLEQDDVLVDAHDPIFFTMINPSRQKGVMVLARLAEDLSVKRPDIPLLVIESRGSGGGLVQAGLSGGFDLRRHENIMLSPAMAQPKEIYAATRALLVPSIGREASGRVVAEALVNGIPPLVSDRGGLAETCNGAGFRFHIPAEVGEEYSRPVSSSVTEPWLDLIVRLEGDTAFWQAESSRAREAGKAYLRENLAPLYVEYFAKVLET